MALELTLDVVVNAAQAKTELASLERGVKGVESAAKSTGSEADKFSASLKRLDDTTKTVTGSKTKFGQELGAEVRRMKEAEQATVSLDKAVGSLSIRWGVLGAAVAAFALVGLAELKFLKDSAALYIEKSGILKKHEASIDGVKSAWERMQLSVGQALIGAEADFRWFFRSVEGGINLLSVALTMFVAKFRRDLDLVVNGLAFIARNIPGGAQGLALGAYGLGLLGSSAPARRGDVNLPLDIPGTLRDADLYFKNFDADRRRAEQIATANARALQSRPGVSLGLTGNIGTQIPIGGALPLIPQTIGPAGLQGIYTSYNTRTPTVFGGGSPTDLITDMSPSTLAWLRANVGGGAGSQPGFFQRGFGSAGQFGAGLGSTVLGAITGGGSILQGVGSYAGSGIGTAIAGGLSGTLGTVMGAILPGIGALLGPLLGKIFGGIFGPTDYEKRTRTEADQRRQITSGIDVDQLRQQAILVGRTNLFEEYQRNMRGGDPEYLLKLVTEIEERTKRLTAAMQKYGISWEDAGQAAKQSQIDALGKELLLDFEVLAEAGFGVEFITEKMSASMLDYLETAVRTGTEVPFALKPIVQQMVDMGLITDESGKAFTTLEETGIVFAKTMSQGFDQVTEAINRVAKALGYVFDTFDGETLNIGLDLPDIPEPSPGERSRPHPREDFDTPSFATGTRGYEYFGSGRTVRLHGWEKVTPMSSGGRDEYLLPVTLVAPDGEVLLKQVVRVGKLNGWA